MPDALKSMKLTFFVFIPVCWLLSRKSLRMSGFCTFVSNKGLSDSDFGKKGKWDFSLSEPFKTLVLCSSRQCVLALCPSVLFLLCPDESEMKESAALWNLPLHAHLLLCALHGLGEGRGSCQLCPSLRHYENSRVSNEHSSSASPSHLLVIFPNVPVRIPQNVISWSTTNSRFNISETTRDVDSWACSPSINQVALWCLDVI